MDAKDYVSFIRRRWLVLILIPAIAGLLAYGGSRGLTPTYKASATALLLNTVQDQSSASADAPPASAQAGSAALNDILIDPRLTTTYLELLKRRPVLEGVITRLNLQMSPDELASKISVSNQTDTQLLRVTAADSDPETAAAIANATVDSFIATITQETARPGTVAVAEQAAVPTAPSAPNIKLNTLLAVAIGFVLAAALGVVMNYVDSTVSSPEAIETASALPTIGVISMAPTRGRGTSLLSTEPRGRWIEDYRRLRTRFLLAKSRSTISSVLVVSEGGGDGKSFTAANLAIALAMAGDSVILVDANLRNPHLHAIFGVPNEQGLASMLFDQNGHGGLPLVPVDVNNLSLLPAGVPQANPADLLSSGRMLRLIQRLRSQAEFVIFDSPAMSRYADASILASEVDASVLVIESRKTREQELSSAAQRLKQSGATVLGVVLNKSRERRYVEYSMQLRDTRTAERPNDLRPDLLPRRPDSPQIRHSARRKV